MDENVVDMLTKEVSKGNFDHMDDNVADMLTKAVSKENFDHTDDNVAAMLTKAGSLKKTLSYVSSLLDWIQTKLINEIFSLCGQRGR